MLFITACRSPACSRAAGASVGLPSPAPFPSSPSAGLDFGLGWGGDPEPSMTLAVGHHPHPRLPLRAEPAGNELQRGPKVYPVGCFLQGLKAILSKGILYLFSFCIYLKPKPVISNNITNIYHGWVGGGPLWGGHRVALLKIQQIFLGCCK